MSFESIGPGIWRHTQMNSMVGVHFKQVATLIEVKQGSGELLLHSPTEFSSELKQEIAEKGELKWLFAPNTFHHMFVQQWVKEYPGATLVGVPKLEEKREDLSFDLIIDKDSVSPWADLDVTVLECKRLLSECYLFHHPSQTLVAVDLMLNIRPEDRWGKWFSKTFGSWGPRSSILYRSLTPNSNMKDVKEKLLNYPIKQISICHGDLIQEGWKDLLENTVPPFKTSQSRNLLTTASAVIYAMTGSLVSKVRGLVKLVNYKK